MSENDNPQNEEFSSTQIPQGAPGGGAYVEDASPFSRPTSLTEDQEREIFERLNAAQKRMAEVEDSEEYFEEDEESQVEYEALPQDEEGHHTPSEMEVFAKLGYASKTFEVTEGNRVQLRTLTEEQILDAQVRAASHPPAIQVRMSQIYCLAQSIQRFNGKPWYRRRPTGDDDSLLEEKVNVLKSRYRPILNRLLQEYNDLELDTAKKIAFVKKRIASDSGSDYFYTARVLKEAKYLNKKTAYQDAILEALLHRENLDKRNQFVRDFNILIETLYKFLHPKDYENWKRGKDQIREEEGVDEVIYQGESEEAFRQLKEMGLFDADKFYAALDEVQDDQ